MRNVNTVIKWSVALCTMLSMIIFNSQDTSAQRAKVVDRNGEVLQGSVLQEGGRSVVEQDSLALVALYVATNGAGWNDNSGWLIEMVEFWHGVDEVKEIEVSEGVFEWRVTRINLTSNFLLGELPAEIGMLDELNRFFVSQNQIIGNLPREIEGMTELTDLNISNNDLMTGILPWEELTKLPNLTQFTGSYSNWHGAIPDIAGDFPRLTNLGLQGNPFSGPFPEQFSRIETLERITFSHTFWTGPLAETYADLLNLTELYFQFNPFLDPGPIPAWICDHEKLERIRVPASRRTGVIPQCLAMMDNISRLYVGGPSDELTGEIPDFTFAEGLTHLFIWDSDITGPIPDYLGEMPALGNLWLHGLNVTGPIPQSLANAPRLGWISLKNLPHVVGPLPDFRNLNLSRFRLKNLGFDIGPIPDWIATQTGMAHMRLDNVGLTGEIPESWSELTNLQWLKLDNNPGLTGTLPSWVTEGNQTLKEIRLGGTNIDLGAGGQIPEWLCDMPQLEHLRLNDMGLTGPIPECLGDLIQLGTHGDLGRNDWIPHAIDLSNNQLSGEIPASLGNLMFVNGIDLSNNQLSGEVPVEFFSIGRIGPASTLQVMDLSGNPDLTGPISTDITNYPPSMLRIVHFNDTGLCEPNDPGFQSWIETMEETPEFPMIFMDIGGRSIRRAEPCEPTSVGLDELPVRFALHQNYPNPFNPSTTISYSIPSEVHVELMVYNVIGQRIANLVNETMSAGQYEVNFDASSLSSGTYIYRLVAGNKNLSKSMILIK